MKATVDQEACVGCGLCAETCPDVFRMGDEAASVVVDDVPESFVGCCKDAADACPVDAIKIAH